MNNRQVWSTCRSYKIEIADGTLTTDIIKALNYLGRRINNYMSVFWTSRPLSYTYLHRIVATNSEFGIFSYIQTGFNSSSLLIELDVDFGVTNEQIDIIINEILNVCKILILLFSRNKSLNFKILEIKESNINEIISSINDNEIIEMLKTIAPSEYEDYKMLGLAETLSKAE